MAYMIGEALTRKLIDMPRAVRAVEKIFRDRAAGKVGSLPRRRLRGSRKQLNVMAAWQQDSDLLCLRAYAGGSNTITLYDGKTGKIHAVIHGGYLSSLRTGAASGVAARRLAPPQAETLGLVGPGWQAAFQIEAIARARRLERILIFGRDPGRRKAFIRNLRKTVAAEFEESDSLERIEARSDIVVLATDSTEPILDGRNLKEQALVVSIGANQAVKHEVSGELIRRMDLVVTDDLATAQNDSGDLIAACKAGILGWDDVVPLERVVAGEFEDRRGRILFQSNGIADEDLAVGRCVFEQAKRKKIKLKSVGEI